LGHVHIGNPIFVHCNAWLSTALSFWMMQSAEFSEAVQINLTIVSYVELIRSRRFRIRHVKFASEAVAPQRAWFAGQLGFA
jgi:hypothetical protein